MPLFMKVVYGNEPGKCNWDQKAARPVDGSCILLYLLTVSVYFLVFKRMIGYHVYEQE